MKNVFQVFIGYLVDKGQPTEVMQMSSSYNAFWSSMVVTGELGPFPVLHGSHMCMVWFCFFTLRVCMQVARFCGSDPTILLSITVTNSVPLHVKVGKEQETVLSYSRL